LDKLGYEGDLSDEHRLADRLVGAGFTPAASRRKAELFAKAAAALRASRQDDPGVRPGAFFVPGRIEVLGHHSDYAGGRTALVTVERGFCLVCAPRRDDRVTVIDAVRDESADFRLDPELVPAIGHWSNYPMTVARRIARNFPDARRGLDIALASDLPPAAGMSSSSAMIVVVFLAIAEVNRLADRDEYRRNVHSPTDLAGYLATVENGHTFGTLKGDRGVGTQGGSEDHTAMLCAKPNQIVQYSYCPVRFERSIPIPSGYTFAVAVSGVVAEKTGTAMEKYNKASRLAWAVAELWRRQTGRDDPHMAAAVASSPDAAERIRTLIKTSRMDDFDPAALSARFEHFFLEQEQIVPQCGDALVRGDIATFGRLMDRSQHALDDLLGNQVPQTVYLAASARQHGAAAASAFGAGFGGSVWALVQTTRGRAFLAAWADAYQKKFPQEASAALFFSSDAGPAALQVC